MLDGVRPGSFGERAESGVMMAKGGAWVSRSLIAIGRGLLYGAMVGLPNRKTPPRPDIFVATRSGPHIPCSRASIHS
jgi:hypothetical protein